MRAYLHKDDYKIIENYSPFILGINEKFEDDFFEKNEISFNDNTYIFSFNLDKKESLSITDKNIPPYFPIKIMKILKKNNNFRLQNYSNMKVILIIILI